MPRTHDRLWFEIESFIQVQLKIKLGAGYLLTAYGLRIERKVMDAMFAAHQALMNSQMLDGCVAAYHTSEDMEVAYNLLMEEADNLLKKY